MSTTQSAIQEIGRQVREQQEAKRWCENHPYPTMSDLITRLRENADLDEMEHCNPDVVALERDAADEIARLREDYAESQAMVRELRIALRPFAEDSAEWTHVMSEHRPMFWQLAGNPDEAKFTVGDLRRAAALLEKS